MVTVRVARASAGRRLIPPLVAGLVAGLLLSLAVPWPAAMLLGWDTMAVLFLVPMWSKIRTLDATKTREVAVRDDPSVPVTDSVIVDAGVASVALSWAAVHTIFTLRYARTTTHGPPAGSSSTKRTARLHGLRLCRLHHRHDLSGVRHRSLIEADQGTALRHALISYVFGAVIVGLTINVVGSLLGCRRGGIFSSPTPRPRPLTDRGSSAPNRTAPGAGVREGAEPGR